MVTVRQYLQVDGTNPFERWFDELNDEAAARIVTVVTRLQQGNFSNVKGVGAGVFETKIDFGPGYRVYFGKDGDQLIILLGGGTKKRQADDIAAAQARWRDYKARKPKEGP